MSDHGLGLFNFSLLDVLLIFVPVSFWLEHQHADPLWLFVTSCLAIIPLAGWMGKATEHLAVELGEGIGGLLNASFGNAAELIIALLALKAGLHDVVKASIAGSILGNILLVLGLSMVAGGLRFPTQQFNRTAASLGSSLLLLSAIALVVPAIFHYLAHGVGTQVEHNLGFEISVVLFCTYILSLIFTLRTHRHLYVGESIEQQVLPNAGRWNERLQAVAVLLVASVLVALIAEILVGTVQHAARVLGMTEVFVGVVLLAIVGNAAEHSTAVTVARKGKMDLAINIAIGSSLQIALFVAPVLVFASYLFGNSMDLVFTPFEVIAVLLAVFAVNVIVSDGESNWMEGVLLIAVYLIIAIAFYFLPATPLPLGQ
jgi:Ca2+:H+ antiporter